MGISQTTTAIMVFLTGLLPASCQKNAGKADPASAVIVATNGVSLRNLGEIVLTNANETCLLLADGQHCIFTPKLIDAKSFRLTVAVESPNANGETEAFSVSQVTASLGKPLELAVGNLNITFTPRIVDNRAK
jgi:hypothetical protein